MDEKIQSFEELRALVADHDGVATVVMRALREVYGADRLGVHVRANISSTLERHGLGHFPEQLPESQEESVRIYQRGSQAAKIIQAVLKPGCDCDDVIRQFASCKAQAVVDKIRELVEV